MRLESVVGGGPGGVGYEWMAEVIRSIQPLIIKFGVATGEELGIDTLAARLRAETVEAGVVIKAPTW